MKRLLIHFGYPKAASTTLQNGLFLQLHEKGVINFLGRAFESQYFGHFSNKTEYKGWFDKVIASQPRSEQNHVGVLSDERPNLFSEGLFMMNERHGNTITAPALLHKHFAGQADRLDLLVIIRRQPELIPSYYIQNYRKMLQPLFADYLAANIKEKWSGEAKIFNFYNVLSIYASVFGREHIKIVFFEDFVQNKDRFSEQLGEALGIAPSLIRPHLGEAKLNATRKEANTLVIRKMGTTTMRGRLVFLLDKLGFKFADAARTRITDVTDAEKQTIFEQFKDSNRRLAEEFSLDQKAMQGYGYF